MKNSTLFFRLIFFNLIVIIPAGICVFSSELINPMKTFAIIMFVLLIVLMGFLDVLLYIKNKIDKLNDKDGIYR